MGLSHYTKAIALSQDKPRIQSEKERLFPPNKPLDPYNVCANCPTEPLFTHRFTQKIKEKLPNGDYKLLSVCRRCSNWLITEILIERTADGNMKAKRIVEIVESQPKEYSGTIHNVGYQKQTEVK